MERQAYAVRRCGFLALELRLGGLEGLTGAVEPVPLGKSQKPRKDTPAPKPKPRRGHEPR